MTASRRSARGRTAAAWSIWRPSPGASPPGGRPATATRRVDVGACRSSLLATIAGDLLREIQGNLIAEERREERAAMLERVQDGPAQTVALRASGAVEAQDVEAAIDACVGEAATGLVVIIAPDFGGDFAGF